MSEKLTDDDFIASARKACANSIMNTATGAYLDEALQRLDQANALIDDIKGQVSLGGKLRIHTVKHVGRIYSMIKEWEKR
jgi:hypothetical protein